MSTYVMSDIHGCYDEMMTMFDKINLKTDDLLIIAGDYIDRGPKNYEMLNWLLCHPPNVLLLRGNHDEEFCYHVGLMSLIFEKNDLNIDSKNDAKIAYQLLVDLENVKGSGINAFDYYGTIRRLLIENEVCMKQLLTWCEAIEQMPLVHKGDMGDKEYVVVHAGYIENLADVGTDDYFETIEDFYLFARDDAYIYGGIENGIVVAGHTPTIFEEELPYNNGNIYRSYDEDINCLFFNVDCGCVYKSKYPEGKLACLRLDDESEFYV